MEQSAETRRSTRSSLKLSSHTAVETHRLSHDGFSSKAFFQFVNSGASWPSFRWIPNVYLFQPDFASPEHDVMWHRRDLLLQKKIIPVSKSCSREANVQISSGSARPTAITFQNSSSGVLGMPNACQHLLKSCSRHEVLSPKCHRPDVRRKRGERSKQDIAYLLRRGWYYKLSSVLPPYLLKDLKSGFQNVQLLHAKQFSTPRDEDIEAIVSWLGRPEQPSHLAGCAPILSLPRTS